ncbi:phosphoinositide 3-kinase adapter protein 1-like isoform X2 [Limulus polyphemus]|uniref:Phosphoinositide 3-kinase adapter protein 1-like isoform X2 n=1 Tax=Limulus polyphemus TaxID=6850 RepID=A0ABM1SGB0_LIMPO|nr:phosphoinositide 3-kinase adapter protein 1-like isoform X2 [Limulus polyphemus]
MFTMDPPDVTIVFCNDVEEWGDYLSDCLHHVLDPFLKVYQMRIECLFFPLSESCVLNLSKAQVVLIIMSQTFLDFLEDMPKASQLTSLLKPSQTVAVLCGLKDHDINFHHKKSLVTFDLWTRLKVPKPEEIYVRNIIKTVSLILKQGTDQSERMQELRFELWPNVIHEKSREVSVVLNSPVQEDHYIRVILKNNDKQQEVKANRRNPFTFHFHVPAMFVSTSSMISVRIWCNDSYFGEETLHYHSPMTQLHELLHDVVSPYELLRQSLNTTTNLEVDQQLTQIFKNNLPSSGFSLLTPTSGPFLRSEDELPTLLHFSARYGMEELTSALLNSPGSARACCLANRHGHLPVHIAQREEHNKIAEMLDSFQKRVERETYQVANFVPKMTRHEESDISSSLQNCPTYQNIPEFLSLPDISHDSYTKMNKCKDYMLMSRLPVLHAPDSVSNRPTYQDQLEYISVPLTSQNSFIELNECGDYISMSTCRVLQESVDLQPHQKLLFKNLGNENKEEEKTITRENSVFYSQCSTDDVSRTILEEKVEEQQVDSPLYSECCINTSQQELISITEVYENGTTMTEAEMKIKEWKKRNHMPSIKINKSRCRQEDRKVKNARKQHSNAWFDIFNIFTGKLRQKGTPIRKISKGNDKSTPQVSTNVKQEDFANTTNEYSSASETTSAEITSRSNAPFSSESEVCRVSSISYSSSPNSEASDLGNTVWSENSSDSCCYPDTNEDSHLSDGCSSVVIKNYRNSVFYCELEGERNKLKVVNSGPTKDSIRSRASMPLLREQSLQFENSAHPTVTTASRRQSYNPCYENVFFRTENPGCEKDECSVKPTNAVTDEKQFPNINCHQCESKSVQACLDNLPINHKGQSSVQNEDENSTGRSSSSSNRINTAHLKRRKVKSHVRPSVKKQNSLSLNSLPHGPSECNHNHCSSSQTENIYEELMTQIFPVVSNDILLQRQSSQAENIYKEPVTPHSSKYSSNNVLHQHYPSQTKNIYKQPVTVELSRYPSNNSLRNYSVGHIKYFPEFRIPNTFEFQDSFAKTREENYKNFLSLPDLVELRGANAIPSHTPPEQLQRLLNAESKVREKRSSFSEYLVEASTLCQKHIPLKNVKGSECYI